MASSTFSRRTELLAFSRSAADSLLRVACWADIRSRRRICLFVRVSLTINASEEW